MTPLPEILEALLAGTSLAAAGLDLYSRRIPNWLTAPVTLLAFLLHFQIGRWAGLRRAALGCGVALLVYLPLFAMRAMGGGDVKLMAAVGAIAGTQNWFAIFLITSLMGGVIAIVVVLFRGMTMQTFHNIGHILTELAHLRPPYASRKDLDVGSARATRLPHGAVIAFASLLFLAWSRGSH